MEIKMYIDKILASDNNEKKEELSDWFCEILHHMDKDLDEVENKLYEISEGKSHWNCHDRRRHIH